VITLLLGKIRLYAYCWWLIYKHWFTLKGILESFWGWLRPYFTPRMIPIVLSIWVFTNGVWYVLAFAPIELPMAIRTFAKSYIAFLYTPLGFEKPIILLVAKFVYKALYSQTFIEVYEVKLIKRLDYERYGSSRKEVATFSSPL
jgi:hypothetical protein